MYKKVILILSKQDVEKFASRRAERGVRVQLVLFTDSPHVKHYAMYRDVYVNTVCTFMHECLTSKTEDATVNPAAGNNSSLSSKSKLLDDETSIYYENSPRLTKRVVLPNEASKPFN